MQTAVAPPRRTSQYAPMATRWEKEKAAAGSTYDFPEDPAVVGNWILGEMIGKGASGAC